MSNRRRNRDRRGGQFPTDTRAQGGRGGGPSRSGKFLGTLPPNAGTYPMAAPVAPYAPNQTYQAGIPPRAGSIAGQNVYGDNSMPVDSYGPQYVLVPIQQQGAQSQQDADNKPDSKNTPMQLRPTGPSQPPVYPPGDPIRPVPGIGVRQFPYSVGINISTAPRITELVDFQTLRNLAAYYEGATLCKNTIFRIFRRAQFQISPRKEYLQPDDDPNSPQWMGPALAMQEWFLEGPDKRGHDLQHWMIQAMGDLLDIDALGVYPVPTRGGSLYALEIIAGDTIAPRIDNTGRLPYPPAPAYQQVVYGAPGEMFCQATGALNGRELDYLMINPQANSPYGVPPTQDILLRVNTALRKGEYDLQRFTSGSTPEGVIETAQPELFKMTKDQVLEWQDAWNATLAGNSAMRVKTPFVPPGFHFNPTRPADVQTDFDRYILNVTVARYGLTLDEIGFTETSNRATGSAQEAVTYRNAVLPYTAYIANFFTRHVINRYDGQPLSPTNAFVSMPGGPAKTKGTWDKRFMVTWGGIEEPDDWSRRVSGYVQLGKAGFMSPTEIKRLLGVPALPGETPVPAFVAVQGGPQSIAFIDDLVSSRDKMNDANNAALDAKIASSKQTTEAMTNPQQAAANGNPIAMQALAAGNPQGAAAAASGGQAPGGGGGGNLSPKQQQMAATQKKVGAAAKGQASGQAAQVSQQATAKAQSAASPNRYQFVNSWDDDTNDDQYDDEEQRLEEDIDDADRVYAEPPGPDHDRTYPGSGRGGGRIVPGPGLDPLGTVLADDPQAGGGSRGGGNRDAGGRGAGETGASTGSRTRENGGTGAAATRGGASGGGISSGGGASGGDLIRREWARYYECAVNAVKKGRQVAPFISAVLPILEHRLVEQDLAGATTVDAVRSVFARSREREQRAASSPSGKVGDGASDGTMKDRGAMLAFWVPTDAAEQLAIPGGEPANALHVTLAYLGKGLSPQQLQYVKNAVSQFALQESHPEPATVKETGHFDTIDPDKGAYPHFGKVQSPDLRDFRKQLVAHLWERNIPIDMTHPDYTPHVTLAYVPEGEDIPDTVIPHPVQFPLDTIVLANGDDHYTTKLKPKAAPQEPAPITAAAETRRDPLSELAAALADRLREQTAAELRAQRTLVLEAIGQ